MRKYDEKYVEAEIDRIGPTQMPSGRTVMRQQWRELLFLHWPVPAEMLRPLIPEALTLDTFEGVAYIGLVPFTMRNVRPTVAPSFPPLSHFHETNVRTYVHYQGRDPGVWFFSLDAANAVAVRLARAWFKLPYYFAQMDMHYAGKSGRVGAEAELTPSAHVCYATRRLWPAPTPAGCTVEWTREGPVRHAVPGTLEHFLAERYLLYAARGGQIYSGQVHHTPYPLQDARVEALEENLIAQAGILRPQTPPPLVLASAGVNVRIYPLRSVAATVCAS